MDATIKTQNLQRHYKMGEETIHALRGVDLVVERGEYVAIMGLFRELNMAGHTIVVVTHESDIAKHARRIITILDGKVADDSTNPDQVH